jgi:hypothetical protein
MNTRERTNDTPRPAQTTPTGGGNNLDAIRQSAAAMLAAGDDAITKVLSGNSTKFIEQSRQQGGE